MTCEIADEEHERRDERDEDERELAAPVRRLVGLAGHRTIVPERCRNVASAAMTACGRVPRAAPSSLDASRYAVAVGQAGAGGASRSDGGTRPGGDHRRWRRRHVDRLPPRRARLDRRRPRRPRGADVGLDVPLGRARRPAAQLGDADEDDDVRHRAVPAPGRRDRRRPVLARGRVAPAGVVPSASEELRRQAGWAKTFGLPLELITPTRRTRSSR